MSTEWINVKDKLPDDYNAYLCFLCMADYGEYAHWQEVLYFDFKNRKWCKNDPSSFPRGEEEYLSNWHIVTHWMLLPEPPK